MQRTRTSHQDQNQDEAGEELSSPRPRKQPRKQRPCYSCAECRRLKMRCNRQVPCSNCVRRNRVEFCTPAMASKEPPRRASKKKDSDGQNVQQADTYSSEHNSDTVTHHLSLADQQIRQEHHIQHSREIQLQENSQVLNPAGHIMSGLQHPRTQGDQRSQNDPNHHGELNPLAILAHALEPYAVQSPPSHMSPMSAPSGRMAAEPLYSVPTIASGSSNPAWHSVEAEEQSGSYGTLMLSRRGRSKYLGPTAGSEWLKESEMQDGLDSPSLTRAPSPEIPKEASRSIAPIGFPLNASAARISTRDLLSFLPPRDEAWELAESYFRYCAWHHDVCPKPSFEKTFDRVFDLTEGASSSPSSPPVNPQEIALVFIVMAQGTMFNIEMPNCDSSAEDWLHFSERALVKGDFLSHNMVAGLQTLHLMAHLHLHLQLDKGRRGDTAWPLWGLVMRLVQAMGMHRDGDRWNLPQDVVEERRKVFWECNAADIFQAHCFSRPSAINPEHCDTAFPSEPLNRNHEKSYSIVRFELSQLSSEILNMAMKVRKPPYSDVTELDARLCEFERNVPLSLRCRKALLTMPSRYPQFEAAIEASPEPSRRALKISFQQTNLALNISETMINLHRPYYAKALYNADDTDSIYKPSFYTVIERCAIIIAIVTDIHSRFPAVSTRQWNFWYHVFGSALCLGTLVLRDPANVMASFVMAQIDAAISLFTSLLQHGARTPRYKRNLQWLSNLRTRALNKIATVSTTQGVNPEQRRTSVDGEHDEDVELLGWRTRLIERVGQGRQKTIKTIRLPSTPNSSTGTGVANPWPNNNCRMYPPGVAEPSIPSEVLSMANIDSTNDILREFWDPLLLQDVFGAQSDEPNPYTFNNTAWWDDTSNEAHATHTQT